MEYLYCFFVICVVCLACFIVCFISQYKERKTKSALKEAEAKAKKINQTKKPSAKPTKACGNYEYRVLNNDTAEITGYTGEDTELTIPDTLDGYVVTSIGNSVVSIVYGAFEHCTSLTNITIPDSVTSIGNYAFYLCTSLTSITIPDSVTSIGERAFCCCTALESITIPDSVTSIGKKTFYNCFNLTNITIPKSVKKIGDKALGLRAARCYAEDASLDRDRIRCIDYISGYAGSCAEKYAKENDINFVAID